MSSCCQLLQGQTQLERATLPKIVPSWHTVHLVTAQGNEIKPRHVSSTWEMQADYYLYLELARAPRHVSHGYIGPALQFSIFFCSVLPLPSSFDGCLFVL